MSSRVQQAFLSQLKKANEPIPSLESLSEDFAALESLNTDLHEQYTTYLQLCDAQEALADKPELSASIEALIDAQAQEEGLTLSQEGALDKIKDFGAKVWEKVKEIWAKIVALFETLMSKLKAIFNHAGKRANALKVKAAAYVKGSSQAIPFSFLPQQASYLLSATEVVPSEKVYHKIETSFSFVRNVARHLDEAVDTTVKASRNAEIDVHVSRTIRTSITHVISLWTAMIDHTVPPTIGHELTLDSGKESAREAFLHPQDDLLGFLRKAHQAFSVTYKGKSFDEEKATHLSMTGPQLIDGLTSIERYWDMISQGLEDTIDRVKRARDYVTSTHISETQLRRESDRNTSMDALMQLSHFSLTVSTSVTRYARFLAWVAMASNEQYFAAGEAIGGKFKHGERQAKSNA